MDSVKRDEEGYIIREINKLIEWNQPNGSGCIVSDMITKEGYKVGYMYREEPDETNPDSGWRFMAGNEDEDYMNNPNNHHIFDINTICNYDSNIIPYLNSDIGSAYVRKDSKNFVIDDGEMPIFVDKQI